MDDPVLAFAKSVRLVDCRIINTPNLIFLCGGPTPFLPLTQFDLAPYHSARDYFKRYMIKNQPDLYTRRVKVAEQINRRFEHDGFSDLLEFEERIAVFCDSILLFVESPGSIAELGAFATSKILREKTIAIMSTEYPRDDTFIADGPVRRLRNERRDAVRYFDWNPLSINEPKTLEALKAMSEELVQLLTERDQPVVREPQLNQEFTSHTMLLIADLIDILGITVESEISQCLTAWGYQIKPQLLTQYISVLERLKIVKQLPYSAECYWVSKANLPYIRYDFTPIAPLRDRDRDRERLKSLIRASLRTRDSKRSGVFERYLLQQEAKLKPAHV